MVGVEVAAVVGAGGKGEALGGRGSRIRGHVLDWPGRILRRELVIAAHTVLIDAAGRRPVARHDPRSSRGSSAV